MRKYILFILLMVSTITISAQNFIRGKVTDESDPGPQCNHQPGGVLERFLQQLVTVVRRGIELDALRSVTLNPLLHPQENLGIDRLRATVTTPQPAGNNGEQK